MTRLTDAELDGIEAAADVSDEGNMVVVVPSQAAALVAELRAARRTLTAIRAAANARPFPGFGTVQYVEADRINAILADSPEPSDD